MKLVTKSEYARICGVSRQAIQDVIKREVIEIIGEGRKSKIDIESYKAIQYMKHSNSQRKGTAEKLAIEIVKTNKPPNKKGNKPASDEIVKEQSESISITVPKNNGHGKDVEELIKLAHRLEEAKTEKMEQQAIGEKLKNARVRGELIDREQIYNNLFLYLDKLHSNLERLADSYLSDVGGQIIDNKKVLPEHRTIWRNEIMSQIDDSKNVIVKHIKKVEKDQK